MFAKSMEDKDMRLTPRETDKLMLHLAGLVAKERIKVKLSGSNCLYKFRAFRVGKGWS